MLFEVYILWPGAEGMVRELIGLPWLEQPCKSLRHAHISKLVHIMCTFNSFHSWKLEHGHMAHTCQYFTSLV